MMDTSNQNNTLFGPEFELKVANAKEVLRRADRIAVFTGAGVSAESGIPTFRDEGGFWVRFPPEQFARWSRLGELLESDPSQVAEFAIQLIVPILAAQPNSGHTAIADLEKLGKHVTVITQNIDGLHQRAGSSRVIELHGSIFEVRHEERTGIRISNVSAERLGSTVQELENLLQIRRPTRAQFLEATKTLFGMTRTGGIYRPNLVLLGDLLSPAAWDDAVNAVNECDCLLIAGTSQLIYPAASLPEMARFRGVKIVATGLDACPCDVWLYGRAGVVLPKLALNS